MFVLSLPSPVVPFFEQRNTLDGVDYILRFEWNTRGGWYCGLRDASTEEDIFSPQRIRANWNLLFGCTDDRRPPGVLMALDTSLQALPPGYTELGDRVLFVYLPVDEVADMRAGRV